MCGLPLFIPCVCLAKDLATASAASFSMVFVRTIVSVSLSGWGLDGRDVGGANSLLWRLFATVVFWYVTSGCSVLQSGTLPERCLWMAPRWWFSALLLGLAIGTGRIGTGRVTSLDISDFDVAGTLEVNPVPVQSTYLHFCFGNCKLSYSMQNSYATVHHLPVLQKDGLC